MGRIGDGGVEGGDGGRQCIGRVVEDSLGVGTRLEDGVEAFAVDVWRVTRLGHGDGTIHCEQGGQLYIF